jgi:hypothetical protein
MLRAGSAIVPQHPLDNFRRNSKKTVNSALTTGALELEV